MAAGPPPPWHVGLPRSVWTYESLAADHAAVVQPSFQEHCHTQDGEYKSPYSYRFYGDLSKADVIVFAYQWGGGETEDSVPQHYGHLGAVQHEGDWYPCYRYADVCTCTCSCDQGRHIASDRTL